MHIQLRDWRSSKIRIRCSVYLHREQGRLLFEFLDHILGLNHLILCASESYKLLSALTAYHCFGRQLIADQWETCAVRLSITVTQRPHFPYDYQKLSRTVGGLNTSAVMCITFPHRPIHSFYIPMYFSHPCTAVASSARTVFHLTYPRSFSQYISKNIVNRVTGNIFKYWEAIL